MKIKFLIILIILFNTQITTAKLNILSTIKPIFYLVNGVNKNINYHEVMVNSSISPHDYHPKPSDIRKIKNATIIFRIHSRFQPRINKLLSTNTSKTIIISLSDLKSIKLLANEIHLNKNHNTKKNIKKDNHTAQTTIKDHGHVHDHGVYDLHIWLSPINAIIITKEIALQLSKLDKQNTKKYHFNALNQIKKIKKLNYLLHQKLSSLNNKNFFSYHDAYGYFTENFNLNHSIAITPSQNHQISVKKMKNILKLSKSKNINCIMLEPQFNDKISKIIIKNNLKTRVNTWDPIGFNLELKENSYILLIKNMANNLIKCFNLKN